MKAVKLDYEELLYAMVRIEHSLLKRGFELPMTVKAEKDSRILFTFEIDSRGHCESPFSRELPDVDLPVSISIADRHGNAWQGYLHVPLWRRLLRLSAVAKTRQLIS